MRCLMIVFKFTGFWIGIFFASFSPTEQKKLLNFSFKLG